jgi:hypothetical protein
VKCTDFGAWEGTPIPDEVTCPTTIAPVALCGGACGACSTDEECTGRSPLHPFGWCTLRPLSVCTPGAACPEAGYACFTYAVQSDAEPFAYQNGYCLPSALCDGLATQLPGGGTCTH